MKNFIWKLKNFRWEFEYGLKIIILILFSALFFIVYINMTTLSLFFHNFNSLYNHFQFYSFYVGQGESSLVIVNNTTFLYDAGLSEHSERLCDEISAILRGNNLSKIDYFIISHPHIDHTGGAMAILNRFDVENIFRPKVVTPFEENENNYAVNYDKDYIKLIEKIEEENANIQFITPQEFSLNGISVRFWTPQSATFSDENEISPIVTIAYNDKTVMLTGDAVASTEAEFLEFGENLKVDILQVSHHGSKTASTAPFLNSISPTLAVISCGIDNSYNFPAEEVIDRLYDAGASEIFITKDSGTVGISLNETSYKVASGFVFDDKATMLTVYFILFFLLLSLKFPKKKRLNYKNLA